MGSANGWSELDKSNRKSSNGGEAMLCLKAFKLKNNNNTLQSQNKVCRPQISARPWRSFWARQKQDQKDILRKTKQQCRRRENQNAQGDK